MGYPQQTWMTPILLGLVFFIVIVAIIALLSAPAL
jgi:hypothetical protein